MPIVMLAWPSRKSARHVSGNRKVSSTNPPVLRGYHVLRNYLKNKAFCAIQVYANVLATHYTTIAHCYTPSSIANP